MQKVTHTLGLLSSLSLTGLKQFQIISKRKKHSKFTPYLQSPGKPLISLSPALVLQREVFPAPCTGQHDTFLACRGWLCKQETRCFPRIMLLQQVSKVVQELFEKPPSWIVSPRGPVSHRFLQGTARCDLGYEAIAHPYPLVDESIYVSACEQRTMF